MAVQNGVVTGVTAMRAAASGGVAEDAGFVGACEGLSVAGDQRLGLAVGAATPHAADGVDDPWGGSSQRPRVRRRGGWHRQHPPPPSSRSWPR